MEKLIPARRGLIARKTRLAIWVGLAAGVALFASCRSEAAPATQQSARVAATAPGRPVEQSNAQQSYSVRTRIGFRSKKNLDEHFAKHGREFRGLSKDQYLLAAQTLRDRPVGGGIEEILRDDGSASRFDKESGAFLAFNRDGTIRTFFKPNDGERYFRRQAERSH